MAAYVVSSMSALNGHSDSLYDLSLHQVGHTEYIDTHFLELLATDEYVCMQQNPVSGEVRPVQDEGVDHIGNGNNTSNVSSYHNGSAVGGCHASEPQIPIITISDEDDASTNGIDMVKLSEKALRILRTCKYRRHLFASALQHFDLHFQIFNSSFAGDRFERYTDIVPTLYAVQRAGNELVPPHKHFSDAVQMYRVFLAEELLGYLDPEGSVTLEIEQKFNDLSDEYGGVEGKIRSAMGDMYHGPSGDGKKMIAEYVEMFKRRDKILQSQFKALKVLVERTLTEINKIA